VVAGGSIATGGSSGADEGVGEVTARNGDGANGVGALPAAGGEGIGVGVRTGSIADSGEVGLTAERRGAADANSLGSALAENLRPADAGSADSGFGRTGAGGGTGVLAGTSSGSTGLTGLAGLGASRRGVPSPESLSSGHANRPPVGAGPSASGSSALRGVGEPSCDTCISLAGRRCLTGPV
jgi:hypothetical protein